MSMINPNDYVPLSFNDMYWLDINGNIVSRYNNLRILKGLVKPDGYKMYFLKKNNEDKGKWYYAHRLVAEHYIPNPKNLPEVNHHDGDKLNNHKNNLSWCTHKDNIQHSYGVLGRTVPVGEDHWRYGKTHSNDTKKTMSDKKIGENHPKFKGWYIVDGERYTSSYIAAKAVGMHPKTIIAKCMKGVDGYSFEPK